MKPSRSRGWVSSRLSATQRSSSISARRRRSLAIHSSVPRCCWATGVRVLGTCSLSESEHSVGAPRMELVFYEPEYPLLSEALGAEVRCLCRVSSFPVVKAELLRLWRPAFWDLEPTHGVIFSRGCISAIGPTSFFAHRSAFSARLRAPRRPYRRAQKDVSTSVMSRTRSSSTSPGSKASTRRPSAESAASRCSKPKRASRSRCSTTMIAAVGSTRTLASLRRLSFIPEPGSVTTSSTDKPDDLVHSVSRDTWRSRSPRWSSLDTRA